MFTCRKQGCERDARPGLDGLCIPCHLRERDNGGPGPEPEDKKEKEMGNPTARTCAECERELKEGERPYKGKCPDCRPKGKAARPAIKEAKKAGSVAPVGHSLTVRTAPATSRPAPASGSPTGESVIEALIAKLMWHLDEAKKIDSALMTIKELTGADFEIPEMER